MSSYVETKMDVIETSETKIIRVPQTLIIDKLHVFKPGGVLPQSYEFFREDLDCGT